jgi:hypothetical protein
MEQSPRAITGGDARHVDLPLSCIGNSSRLDDCYFSLAEATGLIAVLAAVQRSVENSVGVIDAPLHRYGAG